MDSFLTVLTIMKLIGEKNKIFMKLGTKQRIVQPSCSEMFKFSSIDRT